ncbi:MAG TPA: TolC family protein [Syntrophales bacterium]|nr:TolC family protein [Syntrophales bacterium]HOX93610.1 TolC family protein [Syntrophales bacterium]HPI56906.1 TolC family protein [Syntrophales bacterium]HPN23492.1 TolC family protein [Syntrophales bacterium]HQM27983.1 TolC family protein [Syntrophales bacterium]
MARPERVLGLFVVSATWLVLCAAAQATDPAGVMTLKDSIDTALKRNVIVHSAREGVRASEARKNEALTGFLPRFSTSYSYARLNEPPSVKLPITGYQPVETGTEDNYNWFVELKQPLFAGGRILSAYQASKIGLDISRTEEISTVQNIILETTVAYFNILRAEKLLEVAKQSVEQRTAQRDLAKEYFDVGLIPKNDLLTAEVELANGTQLLIRAENGLEIARAKFNTLLRRDINESVTVEDILKYEPYGRTMEECFRIAAGQRPEIRNSTLKVEQAGKQVDLAASEFYPALNLSGKYGRFGDEADLSGSLYQDSENWSVLAVASWDFWEWGRTKYNRDYYRSRQQQARDALTDVKDQVALDVKNAYLVMKEAEKRIHVAGKSIEQADENLRIYQERYRAQVSTSKDVLDAQTLLVRARADYYDALSEYRIAMARLERSMGVIDARGEEKAPSK